MGELSGVNISWLVASLYLPQVLLIPLSSLSKLLIHLEGANLQSALNLAFIHGTRTWYSKKFLNIGPWPEQTSGWSTDLSRDLLALRLRAVL